MGHEMAVSMRDGGGSTEYGRISTTPTESSMQMYDKAPVDLNYGEGPPEAVGNVAHAYGKLDGSEPLSLYDRPPVGGALARSSQYEQPGEKLDAGHSEYDLPESAL